MSGKGAKGYRHRQRPDGHRTWCGIPWKADSEARRTRSHREDCPKCKREEQRGK